MAENIFSSFNITGQGLSVQRMRLSAVAKNIANANTTRDQYGKPYQREVVVVRGIPNSPFGQAMDAQLKVNGTDKAHAKNVHLGDYPGDYNVIKAKIARDDSPARLVHDPSHPDADENGYVHYPNVNIVTEMVEMISAQRGYEAGTNVIESAKNIARDAFDI